MKNRNYNTQTTNKEIKSKRKAVNKADIFIYILALMAFILMILVLIANKNKDISDITYLFDDKSTINEIEKNNDIKSEIIDYKENLDNKYNIESKEKISGYSFIDEKNNTKDIEKKEINIFQENNEGNKIISDDNINKINIENKNSNVNKKDNYEYDLTEIINKIDSKNVETHNDVEVSKKDSIIKDKKIEDKKEIKKEITTKINDKKERKVNEIKYKVKTGDAMWKIAMKYNIPNKKLIEYNNLNNPDIIYPGQVIRIPLNN